MRIAVVTALLASSAVTQAAPSPADTFITKLAAFSCPRVSELAPVFGPQKYVPKKDEMANLAPYTISIIPNLAKLGVSKVTIHLSFDIYHQTPSTVTDPSVGSIDMALDPKTDLAKAIGALPGANHFVVGGTTVWHAANLYYRSGELLLQCGGPPVWAQQSWSPADVQAMSDRVLAAMDGKEVGFTKDPRDAGHLTLIDERSEIGRYTNIDLFYVHFKTPIAARTLLEAVGAKRVVLRSHDTHRSSWQLETPDGKPLRYHGWRLDFNVVDGALEKSDTGPVLDLDKLLLTTLNAHQK